MRQVQKATGVLLVEEPRLAPNHSWRHRFKSETRRAGIAEELPKTIMGQATTATGAPLRMAFMSIPNGVQQDHWFPADDFTLNESMEPLEGLKKYFQVIHFA